MHTGPRNLESFTGQTQSESLTLASHGYGTRFLTIALKNQVYKIEQIFHCLRATKDALRAEVYFQP